MQKEEFITRFLVHDKKHKLLTINKLRS